jgi:6-phosphofructokinase 1
MRDVKLENRGKDASGNVKLPEVGAYLKDEITKYCKTQGIEVTLKYIDPTYMIRTVPANAQDSQMCS